MMPDKVKLANKILHDKEALYYDILHSEIWNFCEQLLIKMDIDPVNFYLSFSLYGYGLVSILFSYACSGLYS
jgi:hypothetical protein